MQRLTWYWKGMILDYYGWQSPLLKSLWLDKVWYIMVAIFLCGYIWLFEQENQILAAPFSCIRTVVYLYMNTHKNVMPCSTFNFLLFVCLICAFVLDGFSLPCDVPMKPSHMPARYRVWLIQDFIVSTWIARLCCIWNSQEEQILSLWASYIPSLPLLISRHLLFKM
jgi:hypothetical protein